ncbi:uncharacterized protein LOC126767018, partial [Bactrocera neohumeralis]|uniref:uncharacterized protein LOC126767018 n=1 Tax=Bactrocera neohumeralis TaxID=98809 RepID=UPI0021663F85
MPDSANVQVADSVTPLQRVFIRCPLFNSERPALWFAQLEGQFHLAGIFDEIMQYHYTSSHLDAKAAAGMEDLLLNVPTKTPYTRLKGTLIERLTLSRKPGLQQLLDRETLGDRKPSQFQRHLRSLDNTVPDSIFRTKWLSKLPMSTQSILPSQADMNLDKLASLADKIHDIALPAEINSLQKATTTSAIESRISRLEASINELASSFKRQSISRSRSRQRFRSRTSSPALNNDTCWYHQNFGNKAKRCRSPCSYQGNLPSDHRATKIQFLVDTGADLCTFPKSLAPWPSERINYNLTAANGSTINTYGCITLTLNLGLRRNFTWRFVVADITKPIIGADFLAHFGILPDLKNSCLIDSITGLKAA